LLLEFVGLYVLVGEDVSVGVHVVEDGLYIAVEAARAIEKILNLFSVKRCLLSNRVKTISGG
jgi:predicted RNA-binding protein with EMAP domain